MKSLPRIILVVASFALEKGVEMACKVVRLVDESLYFLSHRVTSTVMANTDFLT